MQVFFSFPIFVWLTLHSSGLLAGGFDLQGHRGCRGLMPENTIPAMQHALDLGVTTLEMDVAITRDSQVVVSHEPFFSSEISLRPDGQPVEEGRELDFNIYRMDYAEVRAFDVGMKPNPRFPDQEKMPVYKPLLGEMIDSVEAYVQRKSMPFPLYNIETKCLPEFDNILHPVPAVFTERLMAVIREKGISARTTIQSFDIRTLQYSHEHYPEMRTVLLIEDQDKRGAEAQLKELGFDPYAYSPHESLVNTTLLEFCHARSIRVIPWTVNTTAEMKRLIDLGVDGLITDYPDRFGKW